MATIAEIQNEIIQEKLAQLELDALDSTSKVSIWRLFTYVVAVAVWALQNVVNQAMAQQSTFIANIKIHSLTWYSLYAKKFQFGYSLPWGEVEYDNTGLDEATIAAAQLVKFAAVTKAPGGLMVKVAGLTGGELAPIGGAAFTSFQEYMFRVSAAGDNLFYLNEEPDSLKLHSKIFYDALVLDSTGKRLDGTNDTPVQDAVDSYIKGIDFNADLVPTALVDALQAVEGVKIPELILMQTMYGSLAFTDVPAEGVVPYAGYVRINNPADLTLEFEALP